MNISARVDYALRGLLVLAAEPPPGVMKGDVLAAEQDLPLKFLERILIELRRGGLVVTRRGGDGGYRLARPPDEISVADVIRLVDGPLATVRGAPPESVQYDGAAAHLTELWLATASTLTALLESVTLADIVRGSIVQPAPLVDTA